MSFMNRYLIVLILGGLLLSSCDGKKKQEGQKVMRLAHTLPESHVVHKAMAFMAQRIAEKSDGRLELKIFASGQLGKESDTVSLVQLGTLDMTKVSAAAMENFIPEIGVFTLPYVFQNSEHYWRFLDSSDGQSLLQSGQRVGLRGLTYYDAGARSFYTLDKMVKAVDDLNGMKIRVMGSRNCQDAINVMGAQAQSIPFGELYSALQQRVVVGGENNPPSFVTSRHYEVCKFYSLNEHSRIPDMLVMSQVSWESLSEQDQEIVQEAALESKEMQKKWWQEETVAALEKVKAAGVEVYSPDQSSFVRKSESLKRDIKDKKVRALLNKVARLENEQ